MTSNSPLYRRGYHDGRNGREDRRDEHVAHTEQWQHYVDGYMAGQAARSKARIKAVDAGRAGHGRA